LSGELQQTSLLFDGGKKFLDAFNFTWDLPIRSTIVDLGSAAAALRSICDYRLSLRLHGKVLGIDIDD